MAKPKSLKLAVDIPEFDIDRVIDLKERIDLGREITITRDDGEMMNLCLSQQELEYCIMIVNNVKAIDAYCTIFNKDIPVPPSERHYDVKTHDNENDASGEYAADVRIYKQHLAIIKKEISLLDSTLNVRSWFKLYDSQFTKVIAPAVEDLYNLALVKQRELLNSDDEKLVAKISGDIIKRYEFENKKKDQIEVVEVPASLELVRYTVKEKKD